MLPPSLLVLLSSLRHVRDGGPTCDLRYQMVLPRLLVSPQGRVTGLLSYCARPTSTALNLEIRFILCAALREHRRATGHPPSQLPKHPLEKLSCLLHMFFYIRLQMPRARLPVVRRISHPARKKDEFV